MVKLTAWALVLAGIAGLTGCSCVGIQPYRDLTAAEISSATVYLQPPDKTLQVDELDRLISLLQDVVIYGEDNSYTEYAGQAVTVQLTMCDGTQTNITAYNPFLVIDGVGYRTKYEPCEALNSYGNRLMWEGAPVLLPNPPSLAVFSDENEEGALLGEYSWQSRQPDGSQQVEDKEGEPLWAQKEFLTPLDTTCPAAELHLQEPPDAILEARCWREDAAGTSEGQEVITHGFKIQLQKGLWIYEIRARWELKNGCGGTATYLFSVNGL